MLWTGLGLSLSTATYLRWALLLVCIASLLFLIVIRLDRTGTIISYFFRQTTSEPRSHEGHKVARADVTVRDTEKSGEWTGLLERQD
jgi:hypothetical protein